MKRNRNYFLEKFVFDFFLCLHSIGDSQHHEKKKIKPPDDFATSHLNSRIQNQRKQKKASKTSNNSAVRANPAPVFQEAHTTQTKSCTDLVQFLHGIFLLFIHHSTSLNSTSSFFDIYLDF